jgi:hypothetical protein
MIRYDEVYMLVMSALGSVKRDNPFLTSLIEVHVSPLFFLIASHRYPSQYGVTFSLFGMDSL